MNLMKFVTSAVDMADGANALADIDIPDSLKIISKGMTGIGGALVLDLAENCLLYTSPSPRD